MTVTPFSGISYAIDGLFPLIAWVIVMRRRKQMPDNRQLLFWSSFFGCMAIFLLTMAAPHLILYTSRADLFPTLMTWGYIVGHVFLYVGLASLVRMNTVLFEWLYGREKLLYWTWIGFAAIITAVNIIFPNHPRLTEQGITYLGASAPVGALIPIIAMVSALPLVIAFFRGIFLRGQLRSQRVRSFFLAFGLMLVFAAGPAHDSMTRPVALIIVDSLTAIAQLILLIAVLFRPKVQATPVGQQNDIGQ